MQLATPDITRAEAEALVSKYESILDSALMSFPLAIPENILENLGREDIKSAIRFLASEQEKIDRAFCHRLAFAYSHLAYFLPLLDAEIVNDWFEAQRGAQSRQEIYPLGASSPTQLLMNITTDAALLSREFLGFCPY